jgi:hypothetical protein
VKQESSGGNQISIHSNLHSYTLQVLYTVNKNSENSEPVAGQFPKL